MTSEAPTSSDDASKAKTRKLLVMYVVLPALVLLGVWTWIKHERAKVRERGYAACITAGRDDAWCQSAADRNHDRCMELTFRPATRTSNGSFDEQGYVECLDIGDTAYWRVSAERAARNREKPTHN